MIEDRDLKIKQSDQTGAEFEETVLDNVHRKIFMGEMNKRLININTLFHKRESLIEKHNFNMFLRFMLDEHGITIKESVLFLESVYVNFRRITTLLDEENIHLLRRDLAKRFGIHIEKNKLFRFITY